MMNNKYNNFTELYQDYADMIDSEFEKRHLFRLTQMKESLENREKWVSSHISSYNTSSQNERYVWEIEVLDDVYQAVMKEIYLKINEDSIVDNEIKYLKNKVIDTFMGKETEYRGKPDYRRLMEKASQLADIFEDAMKAAYYDSKRANFVIFDNKFTEDFNKELETRKYELIHKNKRKEGREVGVFLNAIRNMNREEIEKFTKEYIENKKKNENEEK